MPTEALLLPIASPHLDAVSARLDRPDEDRGGAVYLLAHGAGAPMDATVTTHVAERLAEVGTPVLRFNYAYAERMQRDAKRRPPDRRPMLEAVHEVARAWLAERYSGRPLVLAGKSMGGRIASLMAASGTEAAGLVFLGYPLHPAGKPDRLRSEHFAAIAQPALFLQGTRDALCDLDLLENALPTYGGRATLHLVEGADHDFKVKRSASRSRADVLDELVRAIEGWEAATFPR